MDKILWAALAVEVISFGQSRPFPTFLSPSFLTVGSGPTQVRASNQGFGNGLTALWNGSPRPTVSSNGEYLVTLTAADTAGSQLAVLTMVDSQTGAVIDTTGCPVVFNVQPTGLAVDPSRNRLYLATPGKAGDPQFPPNSVIAMDLASGSIASILRTNSALGDLAMSDDGTALYLVVENQSAVRRIDPATLVATADFPFRPAGSNSFIDERLTVMPGRPGTVALGFQPKPGSSSAEIAIFDNGVQRSNTISTLCCDVSSMLFSPDGKYLFENGTQANFVIPNASDSQHVTLRYSVDSTGIPKQNPAFATGGGALAIVGSTLYTSLATTIDYEAMRVTGNFGIGGPIAIDSASQRAFILYSPPALNSSGTGYPVELVAFDLATLEPLGLQDVRVAAIPTLNDSEKLIHFGADGFVLASTAGLLIFHSPLAGPAPRTTGGAVVNAASQQVGPIAPGEIISIYGSNLGPSTAQPARISTLGVYPFSLGNVQVWFGESPGALLLAYDGLINAVTPFGLQPGTPVDLQVWFNGVPSAKVPLPVVPATPALFTRNGSGAGPAAVVNQDGSVDTPSAAGTYIILYGTGGGIADGAVDGSIARGAANLAANVRVSVGGRDAGVLYAGSAPGLVSGAFQLNLQLPADLPSGPSAIIVSVNGQDSPKGVTLEIR